MNAVSPPASPAASPMRERPRITSTMSYMSNKSRRSSHSTKLDLVETSRDKRRLEGKSDPRKALSEDQPAEIAQEEASLENLRRMQHRDSDGNVITDPDRSNPTRNRMERPLDTIRSFNAAADGTASRRASYQNRPPPQHYDSAGRRSFYGGPGPGYPPRSAGPSMGPGPNRAGYGGYYRNNSYGHRPESFAEDGSQQMPQQQPMPPYGRPARSQQQQMPTYYPHAESPSSSHSQHPSYETMTSGSDELSRSTNPSSQNSSFDQLQQMGIKRPDFSSNFDQENMAHQGHGYFPQQPRLRNGPMQNEPYLQDRVPPPPPKPQMRMYNNGPQSAASPAGRLQKQESVKRQSWIKRTFSRRL